MLILGGWIIFLLNRGGGLILGALSWLEVDFEFKPLLFFRTKTDFQAVQFGQ